MNHAKSEAAFERAKRVIPGGVNSPVRAFRSVGGTPVFVREANGCMLVDIDGNAYIDYVMSWGPLILGHANPLVIAAVRDAANAARRSARRPKPKRNSRSSSSRWCRRSRKCASVRAAPKRR